MQPSKVYDVIHDQDNYDNHQLQYPSHEFRGMQNYSCIDLPYNCEIISLLKDITEEQVNSMYTDDDRPFSIERWLRNIGIDTSLNWLLLKKI